MKRLNNELTHGIHPYHAKFIPEIPREFIIDYSKEGNIVLDPFCGSGTTLLESMMLKRKSYGVDLSVLASMISKAKVFTPNLMVLDEIFNQLIGKLDKIELTKPIEFENKDSWFSSKTSYILDRLMLQINSIYDENHKNIFKVLVSSIIKTVSNKRKVWNNGYIADNVLPNMEYKGDVIKVLKSRYKLMKESYIELVSALPTNYFIPSVHNCNILDFRLDEKVDIVVTSPPYPFAVDFIKYARLSYYWLGENVDDYSEKETGSRQKRNRKNAISEFYLEMEKIYLHICEMVKIDGYFCMTVADTKRQNKEIFFVDWIKGLFPKIGWILIKDEIRELKSQSMGQKRIQEEHKLVFRKVR